MAGFGTIHLISVLLALLSQIIATDSIDKDPTTHVITSVSSILTATEISETEEDLYESNSTCDLQWNECTAREKLRESLRKPGEKIPLYIMATYEGPGGGWDGSGIVPAVNMAFDDINARGDILPGYELRPIWNDTKCDAGTGSRALFDQLFHDPTKIMILGGGCSPPTKAIASTAHYWNLLSIAYGAESPDLSNKKFYPYFYRSVSPATIHNYARIRLLQEFGWNRVATIHENREVYKVAMDHMHDLLEKANITLVTAESFSSNQKKKIENIKRHDARIIIGTMYEEMARTTFCEAYKKGITGEGYVWLMYSWYKHRFWEVVENDHIDCTTEEMEKAVNGFIGVEITLLNDPTVVTVANTTSIEYVNRLRTRLQQPDNLKYRYEPYGATAYDAAWSIGLTLHAAAQELAMRNSSKQLEDFTYNDSEMRDLFFSLMADVHFEGVSGPVSFINEDRIGTIQLDQLQIGYSHSWSRHVNDCYTLFEAPLTWMEAEEDCTKHGVHLAVLKEPDVVNFIHVKVADKSSSFWIGLQQINEKWKWTDTDMIEDTIWIPPGSSVTGTQDLQCLAMSTDGTWQAMDCNTSLPYICTTHTELSLQIIGYHDVRNDELHLESDFVWQGDKVPLDHTPEIIITYKRVQSGIPSYFIMCGLAFIGSALALTFLIFNVRFREQKYMKMSSPNLNNVIIVGNLLIYSWVAVSGIDNTLVSDWVFSLMCQIRVWLLSVGFVLSFGAMFSKTWRVYRVAAFKKPKRVVITDQHLLLLIGLLFVIDVIILTAWQVISPWYIATEQGYERDDMTVPNQKLVPYVEYCTCSWITYWFVALCGFTGLLLIFGMFLAWETRKVQISALNDSKLIGISVYNVVILCTIGGAISLIIDDPSPLYIFTAGIVLFCTTITLCTIFMPKIISVFKYPEGQAISTMKGTMMSTSTFSKELSESSSSPNLEVTNLRKRVIQLEEELRKVLGNATAINETILIIKIMLSRHYGIGIPYTVIRFSGLAVSAGIQKVMMDMWHHV